MQNSNEPNFKTVGIRDVKFGGSVTIVEPVNLYECKIGDGTFVGPFVEMQRNASVGKRCRIQSHAFICELVTIGDDCFIGHGVVFINDTFSSGKPSAEPSDWKKTEIGNYVSIGSNATILPVKIVDRVVIGAGSVVTKDLLKPGIYAGNPARKIKNL